MGIDTQALKLLAMATMKKEFGRTLTIGRQGLYTPKQVIDQFIDKPYRDFDYTTGKEYCEELLQDHFGSSIVDSVDASTYESATIIHDLNLPVDEDLHEKYDTIFDGGCLEHIFNINQALINLSKMCKVGGQILHVLPTNNQCGHGFWQFSPEIFFSLYTEANGYSDTEIFIGDTTNANYTYKLDPPPKGGRHDIQHPNPLYVMVRTVKSKSDFSHSKVYQSDYIHNWENSNG